MSTGLREQLAFPLQAWRKYDTDRSGYIEANELKVGRASRRVWRCGEWDRARVVLV